MEAVRLVDLQPVGGERGSLIALEQNTDVMPFELKRVYYIYDVPANERRGFHAHKTLEQLIICPAGSCKVDIRTADETKTFVLDRPDRGLYIGQPVWREMYDFTFQTALIVYASEFYDPDDYIWDFDEFTAFAKCSS